MADIENSDDKFLAFFNQWESKLFFDLKINFADLGFAGKNYQVSDAVKITSTFESNIKAENCGSYFVTVTKGFVG